MVAAYFTAAGNERQGPFDHAALDDRIRQGLLGPDTLVWSQGMAGWQKARDVADLISAFPALTAAAVSPPPPPGWTPQVGVAAVTPQAVPGALAPFGDRFLAGLIDFLVLLVPQLILGSLIPYVGGLVVSAAYYVYFMSEKGGGQTLGYKAMKIRLVGETTGRAPELGETFLWWLVFAVILIIGWIWYFTDPRKRMLHNIASKTVVIRV